MQFQSPREELKVSLEKIKNKLLKQNINDAFARDISDTIKLSKEEQSQALNKFNQLLAQKEQYKSS
jgi:hypothetical protein